MEVEGKAAIITGGGTGVGRATALDLAARGCSVVINYSRSREDAERTAAECAAKGVFAIPYKADVADDAACREMVEVCLSELGQLDILVQSAGTTVFVPHAELDKLSTGDWEQIFRVNVIAPFQMVRAARGALERSGSAEVVMVSSIAGIVGQGSSLPYCASKAALNNLTIALARSLAPKIRVNAVAPGFIRGRWLQAGLGDAYEAALKFQESRAPLKRVCEPSDVADAILSLVAGSELVTGQILAVEGGMLIGN